MGFFSSDTVFTAKEMKYENFKHSKVMKGLLEDKSIADILDKKDEKKVFYDKMKEVAKRTPGGRLTRNGLREVLGYFRSGKAANIHSTKEAMPLAQKIAEKLLPAGTRRYIYRKDSAVGEQANGPVDARRFSPRTSTVNPSTSSVKPSSGISRFVPPSVSRPASVSRRVPPIRPAF